MGGCAVSVVAPCVDMAASVLAADVYNAFKVAAGWGVAPVNWLQARLAAAKASIGMKIFLK